MLSDFQLRVARIIAGLIEAEDFALAGGAALIVRGDVERAARDLDFFGTSPDAVDGWFQQPSWRSKRPVYKLIG